MPPKLYSLIERAAYDEDTPELKREVMLWVHECNEEDANRPRLNDSSREAFLRSVAEGRVHPDRLQGRSGEDAIMHIERTVAASFDKPHANDALRTAVWYGLEGCFGFTMHGMFVGIEPDGYIHS